MKFLLTWWFFDVASLTSRNVVTAMVVFIHVAMVVAAGRRLYPVCGNGQVKFFRSYRDENFLKIS